MYVPRVLVLHDISVTPYYVPMGQSSSIFEAIRACEFDAKQCEENEKLAKQCCVHYQSIGNTEAANIKACEAVAHHNTMIKCLQTAANLRLSLNQETVAKNVKSNVQHVHDINKYIHENHINDKKADKIVSNYNNRVQNLNRVNHSINDSLQYTNNEMVSKLSVQKVLQESHSQSAKIETHQPKPKPASQTIEQQSKQTRSIDTSVRAKKPTTPSACTSKSNAVSGTCGITIKRDQPQTQSAVVKQTNKSISPMCQSFDSTWLQLYEQTTVVDVQSHYKLADYYQQLDTILTTAMMYDSAQNIEQAYVYYGRALTLYSDVITKHVDYVDTATTTALYKTEIDGCQKQYDTLLKQLQQNHMASSSDLTVPHNKRNNSSPVSNADMNVTAELAAVTTSQINGVHAFALVLYDFVSNKSDKLSFHQGDIVELISYHQTQNWWKGRIDGRVGLFPKNYVTPLDSTAQTVVDTNKVIPIANNADCIAVTNTDQVAVNNSAVPKLMHATCTSLYDFTANDTDELTFKAGQKLLITGELCGWYLGRLQSQTKTGLFPANFVCVDQ